MPQTTRIRLEDLSELPDGSEVPRYLKTCEHCERRFLGRENADYCSRSCTVMAGRARATG